MIQQLYLEMSKNKLKQHEELNLHIPKRSFYSFILFIIGLTLTIGMFYVIIDSWNFLGLESLGIETEYQLHDLMIIPLFIIQSILISFTVYSFVSIFKKLKTYEEEGLIYYITWIILAGIFFGILAGILVGILAGIILGILVGTILGILSGTIWGILAGILAGISEEIK